MGWEVGLAWPLVMSPVAAGGLAIGKCAAGPGLPLLHAAVRWNRRVTSLATCTQIEDVLAFS